MKTEGYIANHLSALVQVTALVLTIHTHLKLRGQNIDPFMGSISFNPYRGQINHDLGHFL